MESLLAMIRGAFGDESATLIANWMAARSRIAEDWLLESGAEQYVLLGAGLDSFAWRAPEGLRVFEVDHPASQRWKQARLEAMALNAPSCLTWVPVDFETESFGERLEQSGLDRSRPTFVSWLGVTPYLTSEAIADALIQIEGSTLAVTYLPPANEWDPETKRMTEVFLPIAASGGETIISLFTSGDFARMLKDSGFEPVDEVRPSDIGVRYGVRAVTNGDERIVLARPKLRS
jgi:methyltransferase (TIGR00027 family)